MNLALPTLFIMPNTENLQLKIINTEHLNAKILSKKVHNLPFFCPANAHVAWMLVRLEYL